MSTELHTLAAPYALSALEPSECDDFERHLASCDSCGLDVLEMRETAGFLALSVADRPPVGLKERVVIAQRGTPQDAPSSNVVSLPTRAPVTFRASRWLAGVAAAALVAVGALGVTTYQANQRADDTQVASDHLTELLADPDSVVRHGDVAGGGSGTLVVAGTGTEAVFVAEDVPNAGNDETYQMWAIAASGATSVGLMEPSDGQASQDLRFPQGTQAFGVTVEPAGGSQAPTSDPVLLVKLST